MPDSAWPEAMVSVVILATSVLSIAATSAKIGKAVNSAHQRTASVAVARNQVSELLARPYVQLTDGGMTSSGVEMEWMVGPGTSSKEVVLVQWCGPGDPAGER
jgi:Tfp pilus assembly protein PilV